MSCGHSATSASQGIMGLAFLAPLCVSWRHRQQLCCLHKSDSMAALTADRRSMFADITVGACSRHLLVWWFDVEEELK